MSRSTTRRDRKSRLKPEYSCIRCNDIGWNHTWIEDPNSFYGGFEGPEIYCECEAGKELKRQESDE